MFILSKFALGAIIMRSAGCIINDIFDKDFDKKVERTKTRPIASGEISVKNAIGFLTINLLGGLGVLLTFNMNTIVLGLCAMPLVIVYPLMKRFTNLPQVVLGLTFNWGALVGWVSVCDSFSWPHMLPLYGAGVCWTLVYDTIYAYQDKSDDLLIGVKSTAIYFGDKPQIALTVCSLGMVAGLLGAGWNAGLTTPFYAGVATVGGLLQWQIWTAKYVGGSSNDLNLWNRFSANKYVGAIVAASIVAGHF